MTIKQLEEKMYDLYPKDGKVLSASERNAYITGYLDAVKEYGIIMTETKKVCKLCNGKRTIVIPELPVIGLDGEYDVDFDVTVECSCINYE